MSYQVLARRYRPQIFADLVGQESTCKALTNALRLGRIPSALVFSGVRGTGKTTLARIFAKAIQCRAKLAESVEPCGQCEDCEAISKSVHEDVLEIDGASHTGVDAIRELQEGMVYAPIRALEKIYIIDEVHMLSQSAFNALLKTIEEPPKHVRFIFATTELDRIPDTILGRCQVYPLAKIRPKDLVLRLKNICQWESIQAEDEALRLLAQQGRGSLRDALSALDQAIARGAGRVTLSDVGQGAMVLDATRLCRVIEAVLGGALSEVLAELSLWEDRGLELKSSVESMARVTRHLFMLPHLNMGEQEKAEVLGLSPGELKSLEELKVRLEHKTEIHRLFRALMAIWTECQGTYTDRYILENGLIEFSLGISAQAISPLPPPESVLGLKIPPPVPQQRPSFTAAPTQLAPEKKEPSSALTPKAEVHLRPLLPPTWADYLSSISSRHKGLGSKFRHLIVEEYGPERISICVLPNSLEYRYLFGSEGKSTQKLIKDDLEQECGFQGEFKVNIANKTQTDQAESLKLESQNTLKAQGLEKESKLLNHPTVLFGAKLFNAAAELIEPQ